MTLDPESTAASQRSTQAVAAIPMPERSNGTAAAIPTYRRALSANELSYFLPSRAYGLNDMFVRISVRAPTGLITPLRLRIVWAILRLRHPLMASRVEMKPGCYNDASFAYTPPSTPSQALKESAACVHMHTDVSAPELVNDFLNGPRKLSSQCLSRLEMVREPLAPGVHEFHMLFMFHHMINDARGIYAVAQTVLELLGGSTTGNHPRTDAELALMLESEWVKRWHVPRDRDDVLIPPTEARISGRPRSKLHNAAWKVDHYNLQRRSIGGHAFPRAQNPATNKLNTRILQVKFSVPHTAAFFAKCKAERVTPQSAVFGLINLAWIRLSSRHPEIDAPKSLPMLLYTAISLLGRLPPVSELSSHMSLAIGYHNVVLPSFISPSADASTLLWTRSREAQRQMFAYSHSPLLLQRSLVANEERGRRARVWARIDDEAAGVLPPRAKAAPSAPNTTSSHASTNAAPKPPPSLALIGLSQSGNTRSIFRTERYPSIEVLDIIGGTRKGAGGIMVHTSTFFDRFNMVFLFDAASYAPGLLEEFWRYVVDGVHEYALGDPALKGSAEETVHCAPGALLRRPQGGAKL